MMPDDRALTPAPRQRGLVRPTNTTVWWRTSVLWQLVRFVVINLRISMMILKSHDTHLSDRKQLPPPR
jgi:hypothetical protein